MAVKKLQNHFLVPKHEILSKEEAESLLQRLGCKANELPAILKDDPIAKELKAQRGDIIRIIRKSPITEKSVYYRIVV